MGNEQTTALQPTELTSLSPETNHKTRTRYIHTEKVTYTDVTRNDIDGRVNAAINVIIANGGKVVSILQQVIGVGLSTVYLLYTIIYEAYDEFPTRLFKEKTNRK